MIYDYVYVRLVGRRRNCYVVQIFLPHWEKHDQNSLNEGCGGMVNKKERKFNYVHYEHEYKFIASVYVKSLTHKKESWIYLLILILPNSEGYSRNASCALNLISTFVLLHPCRTRIQIHCCCIRYALDIK